MEVAPTAVTDTELMLGGSGLQSLLLLWSEEWLQLLTDLSYDVSKRLNTLHREMQRVLANARLSPADRTRINSTKFAALMTPIAVLLERKLANAAAKQDTPYKLLFHERYAPKFRAALANLKKPPELLKEHDDGQLADVVMLKSACWEPFSVIAHELAVELQKHTLPLRDLSPSLAGLRNSHVPLPGNESQTPSLVPSSPALISTVNRSSQNVFPPETLNLLNPVPEGVVTIARLEDDVALLSTKTRPKRIGMVGADGRRYHFLLKGREDMRLDAGIMQVGLLLARPLRICRLPNNLLCSRSTSQHRSSTLSRGQRRLLPIKISFLGGVLSAASQVPVVGHPDSF
jgi:PI-3-kinase-related kinase SMG-1